jgi:hypothetical protein
VLEPTGDERRALFEHRDDAPPVRHRENVEPALLLLHGERLDAASDRNQAVLCWLVEEGVHLVGAGSASDHVAHPGEGRLHVAGGQCEQLLEDVEQPLGKGRGGAVQGRIAAKLVPGDESPFRSAFYAALAASGKNMFNENVRARC